MTTSESRDLRTIQPLLEAGLALDDVWDLLFRVSFASIVDAGQCDVWDATAFLGHQPAAVRAAWIEAVDRMLRAPDMGSGLLP